MIKDKFFILSGAPGSGKTTLLQHLQTLGFQGIAEPAREILFEQRSIEGDGVSGKDTRLFVNLMLSRMIGEYRSLETSAEPIFFDRGIPDAMAYASLAGLDYPQGERAARKYRYNNLVFFAPAWEEIYTQDDERTVSFDIASQFDPELRRIYRALGYVLIDLPCVSVEERARFILGML
jgi:predicted ATPase